MDDTEKVPKLQYGTNNFALKPYLSYSLHCIVPKLLLSQELLMLR